MASIHRAWLSICVLFLTIMPVIAKQRERYDALHSHFSSKSEGVGLSGIFTIGFLIALIAFIMIYQHHQHIKHLKKHHEEIIKHHKEIIDHIKKKG